MPKIFQFLFSKINPDDSPPRRKRHDSDTSPPRRQRQNSDNSPPRRRSPDRDGGSASEGNIKKREGKDSKLAREMGKVSFVCMTF